MNDNHRLSPLPSQAVVLEFPFRGSWRVENSPARRIPSHGTTAFGSSHAIDFVAVDRRGRSAPFTWRGLLAAEPPELFRGFGMPILAPIAGTVVIAHDGEPDHDGRRSQLGLVAYMLGQTGRARTGGAALAGNHVVIAVQPGGPFVLLAHLRRGTVAVAAGQQVQGEVVHPEPRDAVDTLLRPRRARGFRSSTGLRKPGRCHRRGSRCCGLPAVRAARPGRPGT